MAITQELQPRRKIDRNRQEEASDRDKLFGIAVLVTALTLFVLTIVLASIYSDVSELDLIDYWMMP